MLPHLAPSASNRPSIPAGVHPARIYSMIHIGNIRETYMGQPKDVNIMRITFETPVMHEFQDGTKPLMISKDYTMAWSTSPNKSGLVTLFSAAFPGRDLSVMPNVFELLNTYVMINIESVKKNDGSYTDKLASVSPVYSGVPLNQPFNPIEFFTYSPEFYEQSRHTLLKQSNWILSRMATSREFQDARANGSMPQDMIEAILKGAQENASKKSGANQSAAAQQPAQQYHQNTPYQMGAAAPQQSGGYHAQQPQTPNRPAQPQYAQQPAQQYQQPAPQYQQPAQQPAQQYGQQPAAQAPASNAPAPFIPQVDAEDDYPF